MKILIAGAGIAGSVLTRLLRARGHEVLLADGRPDRAASRCAFAYLRLGWWRGEQRAGVRRAVDWYESSGWLRTRTGTVYDVRRGWVRDQEDHVLLDPRGPLVGDPLAMDLKSYADGPGGVLAVLGDRLDVDADHLVLACGAGTDRWAHGSPVYGGVYEAPGRRIPPGPDLRLLRVTDRVTHVAAYDGRTTRVGASRGRTPEIALARALLIRNRLSDRGVINGRDGWTYRAGTRWEHLAGAGGPRQIEPHTWTFTGFARSGYATVPGAARRLIERLEGR